MNDQYLLTAINAALKAGALIAEVYGQDFAVEIKKDNSPLTLADKLSHKAITESLQHFNIPVISEEGKSIPFEERKGWQQLWMIDPLDGTKEFIRRNGDFTVNIALIESGSPVLGVVYAPVSGKLYYATEAEGSFIAVILNHSIISDIKSLTDSAQKLPFTQTSVYTIVASRLHSSAETTSFIEEKNRLHSNIELMQAGSSLKLCMVAEGNADIYPRLAPTMEWDTAAGHAVAKFAGCRVYQYESGVELAYNKENLLNPWFIVEKAGDELYNDLQPVLSKEKNINI